MHYNLKNPQDLQPVRVQLNPPSIISCFCQVCHLMCNNIKLRGQSFHVFVMCSFQMLCHHTCLRTKCIDGNSKNPFCLIKRRKYFLKLPEMRIWSQLWKLSQRSKVLVRGGFLRCHSPFQFLLKL